MDVPVPDGYMPLDDATLLPLDTQLSVIGVVVDYMQPAITRSPFGDYQCSIFLKDPSLLGSSHARDGARLKLFDTLGQMPQNLEVGDIVIARCLSLKDWAGNPIFSHNKFRSEYLFFKSSAVPDQIFEAAHVSDDRRLMRFTTLTGKKPKSPNAKEQEYVIRLREWAKKHADFLPQPLPRGQTNKPAPLHPLPPRPDDARTLSGAGITRNAQRAEKHGTSPDHASHGSGAKFARLSEIQEGRFHDLVGEVRKVWDSRGCLDLYVTDYTFNPSLFDYKETSTTDTQVGREGDPYGYSDHARAIRSWTGPWGKHTICVSLWEPHASYARREIKEGDFVRMRNARCHRKAHQPLQATLHTDMVHPNQVDISRLSRHARSYALLADARDEYWKSRERAISKPPTKAEKRKVKRQREREQKEEKERQAKRSRGDQDVQALEEGLFVTELRDTINSKVVAAYPEQHLLPIAKAVDIQYRTYNDRSGELRDLPFVNMLFRSKVRVVDFYPDDLRDFTQSLDDPEYNNAATQHTDESWLTADQQSSGLRWEWHFYLAIEDAKQIHGQEPVRTKVLVHGRDAESLLKLDAVDLRQNGEVLQQLKRKLFILWGNVEEQKSAGAEMPLRRPQNRPFECCIKEYGVQLDGGEWEQVHRMFQTTIRD